MLILTSSLKVRISVFVHTSTIGLEASFFEKPVITQSSSYYAHSGAVFFADDISTYYSFIDQGIANSLRVRSHMKENAALFYYASQMCSFVDTGLAPSRRSKMLGINYSTFFRASNRQHFKIYRNKSLISRVDLFANLCESDISDCCTY